MDDAAEWRRIREIVTNIIGFQNLIERPDVTLSTVKRVQYEAQVYAGGAELAKRLLVLVQSE